jgi:SAM-dependent methyltransferase
VAIVLRMMLRPELPQLRDGTDLFMSSHVLEHVPDLCLLLSELFSLLKPGGFVFAEVPNHWASKVETFLGGVYHVTLHTPRGLHAYLAATGFRLVDLQLVDGSNSVKGDGKSIRALFQKPVAEGVEAPRAILAEAQRWRDSPVQNASAMTVGSGSGGGGGDGAGGRAGAGTDTGLR